MAKKKGSGAIIGFLTMLVLAMILSYPAVKFWAKAGALADNGVFESVTIEREYLKVEQEEASEGVGRRYEHEMSVFRYGPDQAYTHETQTNEHLKTGMTAEIVYDPDNPEEIVVRPRGRSQLDIFLSTPGKTLRLAMLAGGAFLIGIYLFFTIYAFLNPPTVKESSSAGSEPPADKPAS